MTARKCAATKSRGLEARAVVRHQPRRKVAHGYIGLVPVSLGSVRFSRRTAGTEAGRYRIAEVFNRKEHQYTVARRLLGGMDKRSRTRRSLPMRTALAIVTGKRVRLPMPPEELPMTACWELPATGLLEFRCAWIEESLATGAL